MDNVIKKVLHGGAGTSRLILRMLAMTDVGRVYAFGSNPDTCRFLRWGPYTAVGQATDFVQATLRGYAQPADILWGIVTRQDALLIGVVRIYDLQDGRAEISYVLDECATGKGYMTEAVRCVISVCFDELGCNTVRARFVDGNQQSERVMIRAGMHRCNEVGRASIRGREREVHTYEIRRKVTQ